MARKRIEERALAYFSVVHEQGSIRAAAQKLRLTPSAVLRQVQDLEHRLGVALLERSTRGVRPTAAGDLVARHAHHRRHLDDILIEEMAALTGLKSGSVRIVTGEGFVFDMMKLALTPWVKTYPGIRIVLEMAGTEEIVAQLLRGAADVGIAYNPPRHPQLESVAVGLQPLCVIVSPKHGLARRKQLDYRELQGFPMGILGARYGVRQLLDEVERKTGVALNTIIETNSIYVLRLLARQNLGAVLLPEFAVADNLRAGLLKAVPLRDPALAQATSHIIVNKDRLLSPAARRFIDHIRERMTAFARPVRARR